MSTLDFEVLGARAALYAAEPTLMLEVRVTEADYASIHAVALKCQIRIEPQRRQYSKEEERLLYELFGETPQWGNSLRPFLWTHASTMLGMFDGTTTFDLPIACTYDFEVAGAKYLHALADGEIPLNLLFSGTVYTRGNTGFAAEALSWASEASFRLPVPVYRETMDHFFPNAAWIRVQRDTLSSLQRFRADRGLPTWDQALERLLKEAGEEGA